MNNYRTQCFIYDGLKIKNSGSSDKDSSFSPLQIPRLTFLKVLTFVHVIVFIHCRNSVTILLKFHKWQTVPSARFGVAMVVRIHTVVVLTMKLMLFSK